jgi:U2 small nuclear ribonucleoprotein B''
MEVEPLPSQIPLPESKDVDMSEPVPSTSTGPGIDSEEEKRKAEEEFNANAKETIYIRNLNERVKLKVLTQTLRNLFSLYGRVLSVTAHSNIRMRGQAFVCLDSVDGAKKAVKEVEGLPIYGRGMVSCERIEEVGFEG